MENQEIYFQFKDFLYLNNYFLESYIAQKNNGFPKEIQRTRVDQQSNEEVGEKIDTEETLDEKTGVPVYTLERLYPFFVFFFYFFCFFKAGKY